MQKLILDYSTWRCGHDGEHKLGQGSTELINPEGFMCCLGQFIPQMDTNIQARHIKGFMMPAYTGLEIKGLSEMVEPGQVKNTEFCRQAVIINDNTIITNDERIDQLTTLFADRGYEIEVINKP